MKNSRIYEHLYHVTYWNIESIKIKIEFILNYLYWRGIVPILLRSLSGRIVSSVWWIFTWFLLSSYVANLVAFYVTERLIPTFNSIEDVLKQADTEYGIAKDDSVWNFLKVQNIYTIFCKTDANLRGRNEKGNQRLRKYFIIFSRLSIFLSFSFFRFFFFFLLQKLLIKVFFVLNQIF